MQRFLSRRRLTIGAGAIVILLLGVAFWPSATTVDMGEASIGPMVLTIDEEAKTRVRETYIVSAPVAGRLLRVDVEPGDQATAADTVVARMLPANPDILNVRAKDQADANLRAAEAALVMAQSELRKGDADLDLAAIELERTRKLFETETVSQARLDLHERQWKAARAGREMAKAAVAMRQADLESATAMMMSFAEGQKRAIATNPHPRESIPITAPISGQILRVMQESETIVAAGAPLLEIGDTSNDLEIVAELLSTDAVQIAKGNRVIIEKWGGGENFSGVVELVEPWGFTKFSALGVEEQRVNAIINITDASDIQSKLGHGFRVEARIVIWEDSDALIIPSSALFRHDDQWAVFLVSRGRARINNVDVLQNNGIDAAISNGIEDGQKVVLYPSSELSDGARVKQRNM